MIPLDEVDFLEVNQAIVKTIEQSATTESRARSVDLARNLNDCAAVGALIEQICKLYAHSVEQASELEVEFLEIALMSAFTVGLDAGYLLAHRQKRGVM